MSMDLPLADRFSPRRFMQSFWVISGRFKKASETLRLFSEFGSGALTLNFVVMVGERISFKVVGDR